MGVCSGVSVAGIVAVVLAVVVAFAVTVGVHGAALKVVFGGHSLPPHLAGEIIVTVMV